MVNLHSVVKPKLNKFSMHHQMENENLSDYKKDRKTGKFPLATENDAYDESDSMDIAAYSKEDSENAECTSSSEEDLRL